MVIPALGDFMDSTQLTAQYWQAVGVDAKVQTVDRTLFYDRKDNNEHDAAVFLGSGGMGDALSSRPSTSRSGTKSLFAVPWGNWYASGGKSGEEPPAAVKKQMDLYREITKYSDPAKQKELMKQLLDIAADQFYSIGISTPGPLYSARPRTPSTMSTRGRSLGPILARSLATPSSTTSILRNDAEPLTARLPPSGDRNRTPRSMTKYPEVGYFGRSGPKLTWVLIAPTWTEEKGKLLLGLVLRRLFWMVPSFFAVSS